MALASISSFIADSAGSVVIVPADDRRDLDLGATQPIDLPTHDHLLSDNVNN